MFPKHLQLQAGESVIQIHKHSQNMYVIDDVPILTFLFKNVLFTVQLQSSQTNGEQEYYNITLDIKKQLVFYFQIIPLRDKQQFKDQTINIDNFKNVVVGHRGSGSDKVNNKIISRKKLFPRYFDKGIIKNKEIPYSYYRENSVQAIINGLDKTNGAEFDVQMTLDRRLVISHNFDVDGIEIQSHTYDELGQPILLSDVLSVLEAKRKKQKNSRIKYLDIELKYNQQSDRPASRRAFLDAFYDELKQHDLKGYKVFVTSFDPVICYMIKLETNLAAFYINIGSIIYFKQPKETNFNQLAQRNIFEAINYTCKYHIDGIVTSKYMLMLFPTLKREIKYMGLGLIVWGRKFSQKGMKGNQVVDGIV